MWEVDYWPKDQTPHLAKCTRDVAPEDIRMEEEKVQIKVQEDEEEIEEKHGREQSDEKREQTITQAHDTWMG